LSVIVPATIVTDPVSQTVPRGTNVNFTVSAMGTAPLSYQWRFNGTNIADATGTIFQLPIARTNNAGSYTVVVSNAGGSVTSSVAQLIVGPPTDPTPPVITLKSPAANFTTTNPSLVVQGTASDNFRLAQV